MSLRQLQKKALRELKASPKKAALLSLLAVVAAWFWAPLLLKSSAGSTTAPLAPPPPVAAAPAAGPVHPAVAAPPTKDQPSWRQVAAAIDRDASMIPATADRVAGKRDPFTVPEAIAQSQAAAAAAKEKKEDVESQSDTETKEEAEPDDLGLVLSSTLIGRSRRAALIGGRVYEVGSKIEVEGIAFVLVEVEPSRVTLERGGQQYTLSIKRRPGTGRIELRPVAP